MEYTIKITDGSSEICVQCPEGRSILEAMQHCASPVHAPCGGNGSCRRCTVKISGFAADMQGNIREYRCEEVLACRHRAAGDLELHLPRTELDVRNISLSSASIPGGGEGFGLAVDIGTTTVAAYLYDLGGGICTAKTGGMNAQRVFGSDVISRIQHGSSPEGLQQLAGVIRAQLAAMAKELCPDLSRIKYVSVAGNTVMEHIFAGLSPVSIGTAPFTPLSLFGEETNDPLIEGIRAPIYLCPAVAGYVGGDISAGLLASGAAESTDTVLFIDIGTNGEMALCSPEGIICCATAAGPAFEGGGIQCGSPATVGAINRVDSNLKFSTIGDSEATAICGSGIIDAVAALLAKGVVDETGRMEGEKYSFSEKVYVSAADVRQVQLAKSAIRAGIETLLKKSGKSCGDIDRVLIAGGFGAYMNTASACAIGLLPPLLLERTEHTGNSAGMGAALALTPEGREKLRKTAEKCRYVELSCDSCFGGFYLEAMMFDEWEDIYEH